MGNKGIEKPLETNENTVLGARQQLLPFGATHHFS